MQDPLDERDRRALEVLDGVRLQPVLTGPVQLTERYVRDVAQVERWPENRSGADKTWISRARRDFLAHYGCVRRTR